MNATSPGLEAFSAVGVVGPAGMPAAVAGMIEEDTRAVMAETATAERLASLGLEPVATRRRNGAPSSPTTSNAGGTLSARATSG